MSAERLSALDASFLAVEGPASPMHVGRVALFDPPDAGPRPGFDERFEHIGGRLGQRLAGRLQRPLGTTPGRGGQRAGAVH